MCSRSDLPMAPSVTHAQHAVTSPQTTTTTPSHAHNQTDHFVCGGVASLFNIVATFPINKVMFRQQVHGIRFFKALRQVQREGMSNLYRGLLPPLLQRTATVSLMFGTYNSYKDYLHTQVPIAPNAVVHTLAALGAGTTEALLAPFERIQAVLQVKDFHDRFQNSFHAFREIAPLGIRELYRGTFAIILRNGPSNVVFFGLRQPLMDALPQAHSELTKTANAFISGAGLGAFLSTAFFPINVVKTRMQATVGGPYLGIMTTLRIILSERQGKWRKLYRGVHINYTRSFLSWGIINALYEFLRKHVYGIRS